MNAYANMTAKPNVSRTSGSTAARCIAGTSIPSRAGSGIKGISRKRAVTHVLRDRQSAAKVATEETTSCRCGTCPASGSRGRLLPEQ